MKSFFSKLGVLLLGATFAVVGCTDFAEDIREVGEKVDKVDNKVDNNVADITVNTDAIEAKIKEMEAQHAADKKAAEEALAALKTTLDGKIKADIEAAEAKLTAAYEKADAAIKATAVADKAELKADVQKAADEALKAVADAKAELEAAYKAADEEIKKAYAEADAKLKSDLEAEIATLKVELEKADAEQKKAIEEQIKALKDNLSKSEADLTKMVKELETKLLQADADNKNALKLEIADLQSRLKDADAANKAELEKKINDLRTELSQIDAKNKQDIENKISEIATELRKADTDNKAELTAIINDLKVTLMGADAANKAELEKKISGFELSLLTARTELEKSITALENNFEKQIETINSSIKNLTESIANVEKEYKKADDVLRDEFAGADAALKSELNTKIENLETALKNDDAALKAALELSLQSLGDELRKADVDNKAELTQQITDLAAALRSEDAAMEVALKKYADDIKAALEKADADNKAELLGLIAELESNLKDNKAELEKTIDDLAQELRKADSDLSDKVDNLENTLRGETETVKQALEQKIADLATELREADSKLSDKVDNLENTLRGETEEVKKALEKKIADLKVELLAADVALETKLQANIDKAVADAASALATAVADLTAAYQAADAALDAAIKENAKNIEENAKAIEELKDADDKLNAAILEVADARMIGDAVLEQKIKDEAIARAEAMQALQNANYASVQSLISMINVNAAAIEAEKVARDAAEAVLQQNIDAVAAALAEARADFEQADKDLKALIDKNAGDIAANLDEIVKLQGRATALEGRVAALESWRTAAMAEIAANASAISDLDTELGVLKTAYEAADALLEQKINAVAADLALYKQEVEKAFIDAADKTAQDIAAAESRLNQAISELSGKLTDEVKNLNSTITGVETALTKLIEANTKLIGEKTDALLQADNEIKQTITNLEAAYKAADATINATLAELAKADTDNKAALEQKINETAIDLNAKIDKANTDLTAMIGSAETRLNNAIDEKAAALQTAINGINLMINSIDGEIENITKVNNTQNKAIEELKTKAAQAIADINDINSKLGDIETRLGKAEEDINNLKEDVRTLMEQIQSVVYKPTHADGKARMNYAEIAGVSLDGTSVITYKVYPTKHAATIVTAFNEGLLTLDYDVETVTKAGDPDLEVLSVAEGKKAGEIDVTVRAANLAGLYDSGSADSYSAALVLNNVKEGVENFSTEYTNLVAGVKTDYTFKPYVGDAEYTTPENQEVEYPATDAEIWTKKVLNGFNVKFTDGSKTYSPEQFFRMYPLAKDLYKDDIDPVITGDTDIFILGEDENGYVTACLDETKASNANIAKSISVLYEYQFNGVKAQAEGNITVKDFTWALDVVENFDPANYPLLLPYTGTEAVPVMADLELIFKNGGEEMTEAQLVEAGYCVNVDTLDIVSEITTYMGGATVDLFEIVENPDPKKSVPASVKLAQDADGVNKAVAGHVGTILSVKYPFEYSFGIDAATSVVTDPAATIKIEKILYEFNIELGTFEWEYNLDATADAAALGNPDPSTCTRSNVNYSLGSAVGNASVPADQTIEDVLNTYNKIDITVGIVDDDDNFVGTPDTYTVDGTTTKWEDISSVIKLNDAAPSNDTFDAQFNGLLWGKTYKIVAVYDRASSIVTVTAKVNTVDRERGVLVINDLDPIVTTFKPSLIVEHDEANKIDLELARRLTEDKKYLGATTSVDNDMLVNGILKTPTVNTYKTYVDDEHFYETPTTPIYTSLKYTADYTGVTYGYHYANPTTRLNYKNGDTIPKVYNYSTSFTTWYGQEISVALDYKFEDPKYNFSPVHQYVQEENDIPFVTVDPYYGLNSEGKIASFSVEQVNLNASFDVLDPEGNKMDASEMAAAKLSKKFKFIDNTDMNIKFDATNTLINYNGSANYVTVNGYLTLSNTYSGATTYYPIDETIFTGEFEKFQVRKYDPIGEFKVLEGCATQYKVINKVGVYTFNVLDNFSLKDVKGNELIDPNLDDLANSWVIGGAENGFAPSVNAGGIYGLAAEYSFQVVKPETNVAPTGILIEKDIDGNPAPGTITIDNRAQLNFANPVVIQVNVSIKYPQGKTVVLPITYTFGNN